jgi:DNA-binding winged helix-turn-helix (wHTH) protein/GGDEF domain-containing protein
MPRDASPRAQRFEFGTYALDMATRELRCGGKVVETTPKMFDLLVLLVLQRHRVVPHDELIATVWNRSHTSAGVLTQMMRKLRLALDEPGQRVSWIKGVRGVGYRFVGSVISAADDDAAAAPPDYAGDKGARRLAPAPVSVDQRLYERAQAQMRLGDATGLAQTVAELRAPVNGGGTRRCLIWADIFDCHRERLAGNSKAAWHHLRSAQMLMEGLDDAPMRSNFHAVRGLYFEVFTSETEALAEFELAWKLAQRTSDISLLAGCAARLAFAFARSRNWQAFEQWSERSLQLAAECRPRAVLMRHMVGAALSWQEMGSFHEQAGEPADARLAWSKALRLHEAVLNEPDPAEVTERIRRIAWVNSLNLLASLHPERRAESLSGLLACLADEELPGRRAQLHGTLAELLLTEGAANSLHQAATHCLQALAICDEFKLNDQRDRLLLLSAQVASAQGEHATANRMLRELLQWRSEQSASQAERQAAITAVRLETERVLALAEAEREKSRLLGLENQTLRQRAALLQSLSEPDPLTGLTSATQFERQLTAAWEEAAQRGMPLCVALLQLDAAPGTDAAPDPARLREVARRLLDVCREGDVIAGLQPAGRFGVVFHSLGMGRALPVCERIRNVLARVLPAQAVSIGLADVGALPEAAAALPHVERALQQAFKKGGNCVVTL